MLTHISQSNHHILLASSRILLQPIGEQHNLASCYIVLIINLSQVVVIKTKMESKMVDAAGLLKSEMRKV